MGIEQKIQNAHLITDVYGHWPSFHDAEVLRVTLDRTIDDFEPWYEGQSTIWGSCLDALIYIGEGTAEVDASGNDGPGKPRKVLLRFRGVTDLSLSGFNEQNAIFELRIHGVPTPQSEDTGFEVVFSSSYGMSSSFKCHSIGVSSLEPCEPTHGNIKG